MNKLKATLFSIFFIAFAAVNSMAQSPEGINYQAVITDNTGDALANTSVTLRVGVYSGVSVQ